MRGRGRVIRTLTRRGAPKLFPIAFFGEGRRMLIIAAGLFLSLVAADLLDLSVRRPNGDGKAKLGG